MLTEGVWAEGKVGAEHLRLFAEHNAQGVQAFYVVSALRATGRAQRRHEDLDCALRTG